MIHITWVHFPRSLYWISTFLLFLIRSSHLLLGVCRLALKHLFVASTILEGFSNSTPLHLLLLIFLNAIDTLVYSLIDLVEFGKGDLDLLFTNDQAIQPILCPCCFLFIFESDKAKRTISLLPLLVRHICINCFLFKFKNLKKPFLTHFLRKVVNKQSGYFTAPSIFPPFDTSQF